MLKFVNDVLGQAPPRFYTRAIIFNEWGRDTIAPTAVCALIRHAVTCYVRELFVMESQGRLFRWQRVFAATLVSFRAAVLRYSQKIRMHYVSRRYTNKQSRVSEDSLTRFAQLVTFSLADYSYQLTSALTAAVRKARDDAELDANS